MAHTHNHGSQSNYYIEQIVTIACCGALGGVCVLLYLNPQTLNGMLKPDQHLRVLAGGVGLLMLVLLRAAYVWIAAGKTAAKPAASNCDHDHDHAHCDHDHDHDHAPSDHEHAHSHEHKHEPAANAGGHDDHGHDHSHGLAPWRFALLLLPVVLFLLGLPAIGGMNTSNVKDMSEGLSDVGDAAGKGSNFTIGFNTLEIASRNPETREAIAGSTIQLKGQYKGNHPERFTLVRYKINCCAADAIPLRAVIMVKKSGAFSVDPAKYANKWVQVTGEVQFSKVAKSQEYVPVILLSDESQVKEIPPDNNPYANDN
jgi:hypothetical protein